MQLYTIRFYVYLWRAGIHSKSLCILTLQMRFLRGFNALSNKLLPPLFLHKLVSYHSMWHTLYYLCRHYSIMDDEGILDLSCMDITTLGEDEDEETLLSRIRGLCRSKRRQLRNGSMNSSEDFARVRFLHLNSNRLKALPTRLLQAFPKIQASIFIPHYFLFFSEIRCRWKAIFTFQGEEKKFSWKTDYKKPWE